MEFNNGDITTGTCLGRVGVLSSKRATAGTFTALTAMPLWGALARPTAGRTSAAHAGKPSATTSCSSRCFGPPAVALCRHRQPAASRPPSSPPSSRVGPLVSELRAHCHRSGAATAALSWGRRSLGTLWARLGPQHQRRVAAWEQPGPIDRPLWSGRPGGD